MWGVYAQVVNAFFESVDDLRCALTPEEMKQFETCWAALDPSQTGFEPSRQVFGFELFQTGVDVSRTGFRLE